MIASLLGWREIPSFVHPDECEYLCSFVRPNAIAIDVGVGRGRTAVAMGNGNEALP